MVWWKDYHGKQQCFLIYYSIADYLTDGDLLVLYVSRVVYF